MNTFDQTTQMTLQKKENKKMETILRCNIEVGKKTIREMVGELDVSWVNPRVTDKDYPFHDSFLGKWIVEVLHPGKKMKFKEVVQMIKNDGWQHATIFHLLSLLTSTAGKELTGSFMAAGSLCIDDFEYPGCVVVSINDEEKKLGLGNWRGSKIDGYNIVRVKRTT